MSDIHVKIPHGSTREKAREVSEKALAKMEEKMGLTVVWNGDKATLGGTGVKKGHFEVDETSITVDIDLTLLAKPMKSMVEGMVRSRFEKYLGAPSGKTSA